MKANLNRLFFITILSTTMVACTTNPVTDSRSTATGGNNNTNNNTTSTSTNTNTSSTDGYTYTGGNSDINSEVSYNNNKKTPEVSYNNNKKTPEVSYSNDTSYTTDTVNVTGNSVQRGFVVQLTASISQAKTDKIKNTFAADGYPVIQNSIQRNGQILYRVQIGPYTSKAEARRVFDALKSRYQQDPYVRSAFINENK